MIRVSTGLKSALLGSYGLTAMMNHGVIEVYSGIQPDSANYAPTGTLLAKITKNGLEFQSGSPVNGLTLSNQEAGALLDTSDWVLTGITTGTAGWWRWKWYLNDNNSLSSYYPRMDGTVGESLVLSNKYIQPTTVQPIESFYLTLGED